MLKRLRALLDVLWADSYSSTSTVVVKLWVAAAEDGELYARLVPLERRIARAIGELAREPGGELVTVPGWEKQMQLALAAVRGLALTEQFEPRGRARRDPWPGVRHALLEAFAALER